MANVEVEIASRRYSVACREGEEEHLRSVAQIVDRKAQEATSALGAMAEARHLFYASLLLADELKERREGIGSPVEVEPDPAVADALERLAERVEALAARLEKTAGNT